MKTLTELEQVDWGKPEEGETGLVRVVRQLRHKPLDQFSVEDMRICIGQQVGLSCLVPMAIGVLEKEPLAEGNLFPGDLLCSVLTVKPDFFRGSPACCNRLNAIVEGLSEAVVELDPYVVTMIAIYQGR